MKRIILLSILIVFFIPFHAFASDEDTVSITTWNLEHMMSEESFQAWSEFCGRPDVMWDDDKAQELGKPRELTYCNAHSGLKWPENKIQVSLPLRTAEDFELKAIALRERANELDSDIYAFQEVSDSDAILRVVPEDKYDVFFESMPGVPMQIGFAVRKELASGAKVRMVESLSVCKVEERTNPDNPSECKEDAYRTRPGLELTLNLQGHNVKLLNVHLKSSCRSDPVSAPKDGANERKIEGCQLLRDQVPALENWIDERVRAGEKFIVLGDFNRDFVKELRDEMPARLDGSDEKEPITAETKIGSVLKEISDNEPQGAYMYLEWQKIYAPWSRECPPLEDGTEYKADSCHRYIDHFLVSKSIVEALEGEPTKLQASGSDYGPDNYCADKARPSDHCPITLELPLFKEEIVKEPIEPEEPVIEETGMPVPPEDLKGAELRTL